MFVRIRIQIYVPGNRLHASGQLVMKHYIPEASLDKAVEPDDPRLTRRAG